MTNYELIKKLNNVYKKAIKVDTPQFIGIAACKSLGNLLSAAIIRIKCLNSENFRLQDENNQLRSDLTIEKQNYEHMKVLWNAEKEMRKRVTDNLQAVLIERADHTEAINEFAERFLKKSTR